LFDETLQKAFPSIDLLQKATKRLVPPDGDCLWTSFLQATRGMPLQMKPDTTVLQLRLMVLHYVKANLNNFCLPMMAIPNTSLALTTPAEVLAAQLAKRLLTIDGKRALCSCTKSQIKDNGYEHLCKGVKCGDIVIFQESDLFLYTNFDEYFDGMCRKGAYSEDLEIMALSSFFKVSIAVYTPTGDHQDPIITCFYHPNARGLVALINQNGRGHYDWLTFAERTQDPPPHSALDSTKDSTQNFSYSTISPNRRMPLTDWVEAKIVNLQKEFTTLAQHLKFPVTWPNHNNGKYTHLLEPVETALHAIPIRHLDLDLDGQLGAPLASIDPWTRPFFPSDT
jgi:hypothetical protein